MDALEALVVLPALLAAAPLAARASLAAVRAAARSGGRARRLAGGAARRTGVRGALAGAAALTAAATPATAAPALPAPAATSSPAAAADRPGAVQRSAAPQPPEIHVVRPGECLWSIAADRLGPQASDDEIAAEWPRWYRANRALIGPDPGLLLVGQRLRAPHPTTSRSTSTTRRTGTSAQHHDHADPTGQHRWSADSLDPDRR
ncbi:MAG: LysM peptidoglycan-binding domain-containing protein [Actinobacteria bacterium]|nr:LysM peptidoglycan-binding domain-containing protein [Actinomycetota bacterium]